MATRLLYQYLDDVSMESVAQLAMQFFEPVEDNRHRSGLRFGPPLVDQELLAIGADRVVA